MKTIKDLYIVCLYHGVKPSQVVGLWQGFHKAVGKVHPEITFDAPLFIQLCDKYATKVKQ